MAVQYDIKELWNIAKGLQSVDDLSNSGYMLSLIDKHIGGAISLSELRDKLYTYYNGSLRSNNQKKHEEPDKASLGIVECLLDDSFELSIEQIIKIHKTIFFNLCFFGKIRKYNITKDEKVLKGETVLYSDYDLILPSLAYDLEKLQSIKLVNIKKNKIKELAKSISNLWQIHPFGEGNTRTIAVFLIKYFKEKNIKINSDIFGKYSAYFRNALVRANYSNFPKNVVETLDYLCMFLENLIFGETNSLVISDLYL